MSDNDIVTLEEPGFYAGLEERTYRHLLRTPGVALNQTNGLKLLEECPLAAYWNTPELNSDYVGEDDQRLDDGSVRHTLMLGEGKQFKILDAPDYRTKEARVQRDAYRAAGFVPILIGQYRKANQMVKAAREQLDTVFRGGQYAFNRDFGDVELCGVMHDPAGAWTKTLIDFYGHRIPTGVEVWDYKTTAGSANPASLRSRMLGWAFQSAFQERIITQLKPELAGRIKFRFFVQEDTAPYLCSVVEPASDARVLAHKMVAASIAIWANCLATNTWPSYPTTPVSIGAVPWLESQWLEREISDDLVALAERDPYLRLPGVLDLLVESDPERRSRRGPYRPAKPGDRRRRQNKWSLMGPQ
jgi:hypothetical protein